MHHKICYYNKHSKNNCFLFRPFIPQKFSLMLSSRSERGYAQLSSRRQKHRERITFDNAPSNFHDQIDLSDSFNRLKKEIYGLKKELQPLYEECRLLEHQLEFSDDPNAIAFTEIKKMSEESEMLDEKIIRLHEFVCLKNLRKFSSEVELWRNEMEEKMNDLRRVENRTKENRSLLEELHSDEFKKEMQIEMDVLQEKIDVRNQKLNELRQSGSLLLTELTEKTADDGQFKTKKEQVDYLKLLQEKYSELKSKSNRKKVVLNNLTKQYEALEKRNNQRYGEKIKVSLESLQKTQRKKEQNVTQICSKTQKIQMPDIVKPNHLQFSRTCKSVKRIYFSLEPSPEPSSITVEANVSLEDDSISFC